ncbi:MAG: hypothetical protein A2096_04290 [Spirochaetes bacterium GWF1_41_5]|nr:MAG: hypothetical protein A2096_04290 [Spirochaetes bacterium GWF1_41_5]
MKTLMKKLSILIFLAIAISCARQSNKKHLITIRWCTDNNPLRIKQIKLFEKFNPDIKVELLTQLKNDQKLLQMASGSPVFDVLDIYSFAMFKDFVKRNVLVDLTDKFKNESFDISIVWPQTREQFMYNNRVYAFPCNAGNFVLFYNTELFEKNGIPLLENKRITWKEFRNIAKKLTKTDPVKKFPENFGCYIDYNDNNLRSILLWQTGGDWFSKDQNKMAFNYQEYAAALQDLYDIRHIDHSTPTKGDMDSLAQEGTWSQSVGIFATGKIGMKFGGKWEESQYRQNKALGYNVAYLPSFPDEKPYNIFMTRTSAIPAGCKNPDAAYKFIKYLASEEYNKTIAVSGDALPAVMKFAQDKNFMKTPLFSDYKNSIYEKEMKYARFLTFPENFPFYEFASTILKEQAESCFDASQISIKKMLDTIEKKGNELFK